MIRRTDDGDIDLNDHARFEVCVTGPIVATQAACTGFDVNHSETADLADFAEAQSSFTGS